MLIVISGELTLNGIPLHKIMGKNHQCRLLRIPFGGKATLIIGMQSIFELSYKSVLQISFISVQKGTVKTVEAMRPKSLCISMAF